MSLLELGAAQKQIQSSLLKLEIFFSKLSATTFSENPTYPNLDSIMTDLGGALSLWTGLSFLVLGECVEFLLDIFAWALNC